MLEKRLKGTLVIEWFGLQVKPPLMNNQTQMSITIRLAEGSSHLGLQFSVYGAQNETLSPVIFKSSLASGMKRHQQ